MRFRGKERGTRVADRAKNGENGSRFISRPAKTEISVSWPFFAPKPNGNACYAGCPKVRSGWPDYGQTIQFDNEIGFFQQFLIKKTHLLLAHYLGFDWSGWEWKNGKWPKDGIQALTAVFGWINLCCRSLAFSILPCLYNSWSWQTCLPKTFAKAHTPPTAPKHS